MSEYKIQLFKDLFLTVKNKYTNKFALVLINRLFKSKLGKQTIECDKSYKEVNVFALLDGIENRNNNDNSGKNMRLNDLT